LNEINQEIKYYQGFQNKIDLQKCESTPTFEKTNKKEIIPDNTKNKKNKKNNQKVRIPIKNKNTV